MSYRSGLRPPAWLPRRARGERDLPTVLDWVLAAAALVVCLYPVLPIAGGGYDAFLDRQGLLSPLDVTMGALLLVLVLEACRRTTGWVLPAPRWIVWIWCPDVPQIGLLTP